MSIYRTNYTNTYIDIGSFIESSDKESALFSSVHFI